MLRSFSQQYGDLQLIFLRFCWNVKWPPCMNFIILGGRKNSKIELRNMCSWFYWNFKWPPQIFVTAKNSNLIYGGGWYRTSVLLLINVHIPPHGFTMSLKWPFVLKSDLKQQFTTTTKKQNVWFQGRMHPEICFLAWSNLKLAAIIYFNMPDIWYAVLDN